MVPQMPAANAASSATNSSATGTRRLIGERRQPERGLPSSRSVERGAEAIVRGGLALERADLRQQRRHVEVVGQALDLPTLDLEDLARGWEGQELDPRSEEHTSELQSPCNIVCRLLLEKKKKLSQHP